MDPVAKRSAVWAAIGAVIAIPVPFVGPLIGAVVGGAIGFVSARRSGAACRWGTFVENDARGGVRGW